MARAPEEFDDTDQPPSLDGCGCILLSMGWLWLVLMHIGQTFIVDPISRLMNCCRKK